MEIEVIFGLYKYARKMSCHILEFRRNLRREKSIVPSEWSMTFYGTENLKVLVGYNFVRSENRDKI